MTLFRRRKPKENPPLPPVTPVSDRTDLDIGGRRLGTLGMRWLKVACECGHTGQVSAADLAGRYGGETRVSFAVGKLRCSGCGRLRHRNITLCE